MSIEVRVAEITDHQHGVLDLAKLFELCEARRGNSGRPSGALAIVPRSGPAVTLIPKLKKDSLVLKGRAPILPDRRKRAGGADLAQVFRTFAQKNQRRSGRLPAAHEVTVGMVVGNGSEMSQQFNLREVGARTVRMPPFLDRHITAGVLKQMAGCPDDVLLRKDGTEWHIVTDRELVDLADRSVTYRLGPVEMYS